MILLQYRSMIHLQVSSWLQDDADQIWDHTTWPSDSKVFSSFNSKTIIWKKQKQTKQKICLYLAVLGTGHYLLWIWNKCHITIPNWNRQIKEVISNLRLKRIFSIQIELAVKLWSTTFFALKTDFSVVKSHSCKALFFPLVAMMFSVWGDTLIRDSSSPLVRALISTCSLPLNLHSLTCPLSAAVSIALIS